jgi:two-component system response regulator FlrC
MTAHGAVRGAVEAMRLGAIDYLVKPFEPRKFP